MTGVYVSISFLVLIAVVIFLAIRYGKKDVILEQQAEDLKRAKIAKDTDGSTLDDKWMRFRD